MKLHIKRLKNFLNFLPQIFNNSSIVALADNGCRLCDGGGENLSSEEINKLKDLCDAHFAYLYDDNYIVNVENKFREYGYDGRTKKPYTHIDIRKLDESVFTWSDIKDYFIPFTNHLSSEYPLARITFRKKENIFGWVYQDYNIENILENNIKDNLKIREVSITI